MKRNETRVERIMAAAYDQAFKTVVEPEVRKLLKKYPEKYARYVHGVGWGPSFFKPDGGMIGFADEMGTKTGEEVMKFCDWFFDNFGAGNEEIVHNKRLTRLGKPPPHVRA